MNNSNSSSPARIPGRGIFFTIPETQTRKLHPRPTPKTGGRTDPPGHRRLPPRRRPANSLLRTGLRPAGSAPEHITSVTKRRAVGDCARAAAARTLRVQRAVRFLPCAVPLLAAPGCALRSRIGSREEMRSHTPVHAPPLRFARARGCAPHAGPFPLAGKPKVKEIHSKSTENHYL